MFTNLSSLTKSVFPYDFCICLKELLQRNHLELLKFTGASYTEVLGIQKAASRAVTPRAQTVSILTH